MDRETGKEFSLMKNQNENTVVRKYNIGGTTYIVKASVKSGSAEDAVKKVRRLIRGEMQKAKQA
ncbi:transposon-encoded TnpW family protein [Christensenella intestinihominis]|uniref:transposon-encoded TnpW family protein n=2 Tax=Christensenella intestinihominis TaxID=1851429 RepID=UPI001F205068|nr:transposon-encoded TnpW family protein [Christensenella intestinihominis]